MSQDVKTETDIQQQEEPALVEAHGKVVSRPWHLDYPEGVDWARPMYIYWGAFLALHLAVPLAFIPWAFSWTGVVVALCGLYVFGTLGINLCYHRLLTHRGFEVPLWLEHFLALLGLCCLQDTPARWVTIHRMHHQYSDENPDPHSPLVTFFWGHMGWLLVENRKVNNIETYERYSRDLLRDPFYFAFERNLLWVWTYLGHALLFYLVGFAVGAAGLVGEGGWMSGVQFGTSILLWGVVVRTVAVWHITWSVNSVTHLWGYRNYETGENSRNNWLVGLWSNGEGWHNNHHADQRAAAHGHKWWEFDVTWITVRLLERVGLAKNIVLPRVWTASQ